MNDNSYPRETVEHMGIGTVTVGGVESTSYTVSVVEKHERPTVFVANTVVDGVRGVTIGGLSRGDYAVYVKAGTVVIEAGRFEIT